MNRLTTYLVLAAFAALSGCETIAGNASAARLAAPLRTGLLSGELGAGLDDKATAMAAGAEYRALETGKAGSAVTWKASDTVYGSVTPQQPYAVGSTNCRRYTHTISVRGEIRSAAATACRGDDGTWSPLT